jgi:N-acetylglucosamine-6-phosphate deacetylase
VDALATLKAVHASPAAGARAGGAHLEGPFLSPRWAGAHDPDRLLAPDRAIADRLLDAGPLAVMTLAPELPQALALVEYLVHRGVSVSIGHTDATAEQCHDAFDAGAAMLTHCYNAHRRFAGRDPGPFGAALADPRVEVGLIADGVHVADDSLRLVAAAAPGRMVLVTDAIAPAGTASDSWTAGGVEVTVRDGAARLADGTLAGGVGTMDGCVRRMIGLGVAPEVVIRAAGGGRLRPGAPADVVVLDDAWEVVTALIA